MKGKTSSRTPTTFRWPNKKRLQAADVPQMRGDSPVGHGFLSLYDVTCDWFSSIRRWFPADESRVVVNLQHRWLFGSIRHLCDEHTKVHR